MLEPLVIPNLYFWSRERQGSSLPENSYLFSTQRGNCAIDPLGLDEAAHDRIHALGGIATVIVTSTRNQRDSSSFATRYGATIVDGPEDGQEVFPGVTALRLAHQQNEPEFAINIREQATIVVGDCLLGTPAGALSMHDDVAYRDARAAALELRRILRENPRTILVGRGQSIFSGAYDVLYRLLYERVGCEVHRVNLDELSFVDERAERDAQPSVFACLDAEVGFLIGARKLGYRVSTLPPGKRFCPLHSHAREEELFFVLDGEPSVRTLSGTLRCRKGDFVAFPVGESGTHQLLNERDAPATVLLLGRVEETEACYYPDSDKLLLDTEVPLAGGRRSMLIKGSPDLDYFEGEQ
jgi:uncharacterized cupin superfamily protein